MIDRFLDYSDFEDALLEGNLAKLGDPLANFIYSLGKSMACEQPMGDKVSNEVLSNALSAAELRYLAPSRVDRHRLGDFVEAIIAFAWLKGEIEIDEAANILADYFEDVDFDSRKEVSKAAEEGFEKLLSVISGRIPFE